MQSALKAALHVARFLFALLHDSASTTLCPPSYSLLAMTGELSPVKSTDGMISLQDDTWEFLHHRHPHLDLCTASLGVIASAL